MFDQAARSLWLEDQLWHKLRETFPDLQRITDIGEPPAGFGLPYPVRNVERARLRLYVNATAKCIDPQTGDSKAHPKIRAASDDLAVTCQVCGNPYVKA